MSFSRPCRDNAGRGRAAHQLEVRPYAGWALVTCRVATTRNADGTPGGGNFWNTRVFVRDRCHGPCRRWARSTTLLWNRCIHQSLGGSLSG